MSTRGLPFGFDHDLHRGLLCAPNSDLAHQHRHRLEAAPGSRNQDLGLVLADLDRNTAAPREEIAQVAQESRIANADTHRERPPLILSWEPPGGKSPERRTIQSPHLSLSTVGERG